ncbi:chitin synthase-domain-containing protein [Dipodascopsis tothii]|uniref:chitin synthase-domain-containing protein n=1 Tax=Dipodascopsis tothii TaxID=44089 RepID=UPI0034D01274
MDRRQSQHSARFAGESGAPADDLAQIAASFWTEKGVTSHLASRFEKDLDVSRVSSRVVVAINSNTNAEPDEVNDMARRAHERLVKRGENQVVLFMGEPGAGKSELRHAFCQTMAGLDKSRVSAVVGNAEFMFSALTTARTRTSPFSSHSGLLLEYQYSPDATLIGTKVLNYRLDRARVTTVPTGERNFHIFYYLLAGLTKAERAHLNLDSAVRYRYLGHPTQVHVRGLDDAAGFTRFKTALRELHFSRIHVAEICQILAAIIHIGQLEFESTDEGATSVKNQDVLELIAMFLGLKAQDLEIALSLKAQMFGRERVTIVLDAKGAQAHADELARALYTALELWIIETINENFSEEDVAATLSVVDFPGFATNLAYEFDNSTPTYRRPGCEVLDQLLLNTANEVLFNYMMDSFFEGPSHAMTSEGIDLPAAMYFDNTSVVQLLTNPDDGLLKIMDDHTRKQKTPAQFLKTLERRVKDKQIQGMPVIETSHAAFSVKHFDGLVEYAVEDLLDANLDDISGDLMALFMGTSSEFVTSLFSSDSVTRIHDTRQKSAVLKAQVSAAPSRKPTVRRSAKSDMPVPVKTPQVSNVSGQFSAALETLKSSFADANSYFVLCLRSNDRRVPKQFDMKCVREQITAFGLVDIIKRVQTMNTSVFMPYAEVMGMLGFDTSEPMIDPQDRAIQIISEHGWFERDARVGRTGMFLSEDAWRELINSDGMDYTARFTQPEMEGYSDVTLGNKFNQPAAKDVYVNPAEGVGSYIYSTEDLLLDAEKRSGTGADSEIFNGVVDKQMLQEKGEAPAIEPVASMKVSPGRRRWMFLVMLLTWWVPEASLSAIGKMKRPDVRLAWREKFAINLLIWAACAFVIFIIVGLPTLICPTQHIFNTGELDDHSFDANSDKTYVAIRGEVFDLTNFGPGHYPSIVSQSSLMAYGGTDASDLFPVQVSALCKGVTGSVDPAVTLSYTGSNYTDDNAAYHDFRYFQNDSRPDWYYEQMLNLRQNFKVGDMGYSQEYLNTLVANNTNTIALLHGRLYDISSYMAGGRRVIFPAGSTRSSDDIDTDFLSTDLLHLFTVYNGQDISKKFDQLSLSAEVKHNQLVCLRNLYYFGRLDTRNSARCQFARYFLLAISCFLVAIIGFKFIAALHFTKTRKPENLNEFIICQIPAYTEDEWSLRRAIESLATMKYDDKAKLLFIICDGMILGAGNDRPTPKIVLDILGVSDEVDPEPLDFESLGEGQKQHNMAKVYSGLYELQGHIVPFIVVVKVGKPTELIRPGNRGKRDSQMILMRFLNRVHHNSPMNPLELELYHQMRNVIGVSPTLYEYVLQVDADTQVLPEAANRMVSAFLHDTKIIALCGETALSNARKSIITMIQVYEYYISHNLAKAFESLFGSVTCLPGCFSMFRIRAPNKGVPLFVSTPVVEGYSDIRVDTLHMKNLLHLGEDRYLTTLLLKHHPTLKTKFIRDAFAFTDAPENWKVFLSQRRRWINSTIHNLCELAPLSQLCGFCCFSMRFVVFIDLVSTIIQPVTVGYLVYLFYKIASDKDSIPTTSLIILGAIYGLQALVFIVRRRWEMIGWMVFYLCAIPVFGLGLPVYAFWHMDDFSWGNTRIVFGENGKQIVMSDEGTFDPASIPKKRWSEYQSALQDQCDSLTIFSDSRTNLSYQQHGYAPSMVRSDYYSEAGQVPPSMVSAPYGAPSNRFSAMSGVVPQRYDMFAQSSSIAPNGDMEMGVIALPSDERILEEIRSILSTADLMRTTKKSVRLELEQRFGVSLDAKRDFVNTATETILAGEL